MMNRIELTLRETRLAWALARAVRSLRSEVECLLESWSDEEGYIEREDDRAAAAEAIDEIDGYIILLREFGINIDDVDDLRRRAEGLERAPVHLAAVPETGAPVPAAQMSNGYWRGAA